MYSPSVNPRWKYSENSFKAKNQVSQNGTENYSSHVSPLILKRKQDLVCYKLPILFILKSVTSLRMFKCISFSHSAFHITNRIHRKLLQCIHI